MKIAVLGSDSKYLDKLVSLLKLHGNKDMQFVPFVEPKPSINTFDKCIIVYDPLWDNIAEYTLKGQYKELCPIRPFYLYVYTDNTSTVSKPAWANGNLNLDNPYVHGYGSILSLIDSISTWDPKEGDMYVL